MSEGVELLGKSRVPAIGVPGRAAAELPLGLPSSTIGVPDYVVSDHDGNFFEVRGASSRGLLHRRARESRQDAFAISSNEDGSQMTVAVCDGVGSLRHSHLASALVAEGLVGAPIGDATGGVVEALNMRLIDLRDTLASVSDDPDESAATTYVALTVTAGNTGVELALSWIGDSSAWALVEREWTMLAGDVDGGSGWGSSTVKALPTSAPAPSFRRLRLPRSAAVFLMSDGVGTALEAASEVQAVLADWWSEPPDGLSFARQISFARKSFLDDRTVVGIWPRGVWWERAEEASDDALAAVAAEPPGRSDED